MATATQVVLPHTPAVTRVEAHRVMAVLQKAVERLHLLSMLDEQSPASQLVVDGTKSGTQRTNAPSDDTFRGVGGILEEQKQLEQRYEHLIKATQRQHHNPMDPKLDPACFNHVVNEEEEALREELRDVSKRLKEQSRQLCRQLKDNPDDAENWQKIIAERTELSDLLTECIDELHKSAQSNSHDAMLNGQLGSYEMFARKVLEEQAATIWAEDLVKREKETNQNVKQLQNAVKQERLLKEQELEERHKVIAKLKTDLREQKRAVKELMDGLRAMMEAATEAQKREALDKQRVQIDKLNEPEVHIRNEESVTAEMKVHIDAKIAAVDALTAEWTERKNEAQKKMEALKHEKQTDRTDCSGRLTDKKSSREAELFNQKARENEKLRRQKTKEDTALMANDRYQAATKLQMAIKAFFTRQALPGLLKKAGKKKK